MISKILEMIKSFLYINNNKINEVKPYIGKYLIRKSLWPKSIIKIISYYYDNNNMYFVYNCIAYDKFHRRIGMNIKINHFNIHKYHIYDDFKEASNKFIIFRMM